LIHPLPETGHSSRSNGDTTLLLLLHPVGRRRTIVHFTQLVIDTRVKKDTLGGCRLAGVDVCGDTDIAIALDRSLRATVLEPFEN
jgi:hypothetical protein